ncbi:hypothetical protein DMA11_23520 [Marinilabiliaceae bacterium JC017]|nr:hypothetical protein DMA11_23520 [Marinilabiliaceae bacterium JC017]
MNSTTDILLFLAPALLLAAFTLILIRWFLNRELTHQRLSIRMEAQKQVIPQQLQAYERLTLLLERIAPESLVLREQRNNLTSLQFHSHLLKTIRHEFDHNLAMQVYINNSTWTLIIKAREELLKLINTSASTTKPDTPSILLGKKIIEEAGAEANYHIKKALETLKNDIQRLYL